MVLSVVGRSALSTRQPCQPVARNQEPAKVVQNNKSDPLINSESSQTASLSRCSRSMPPQQEVKRRSYKCGTPVARLEWVGSLQVGRWTHWLIQLHLRVLCVSEKPLMLQCCLWTWFKDEAPIRCGGGRIWGIVFLPGTRALESSLSFPVKESSAMAIERENMSCPNYVFHITCNTRWSAVTAKVTAATTTRTQMQLSRKLMRRLYRSSPWEFSESLWTNWIVLSNSYISLQQYCGSRKPEKNLLWGSKVLLSIGNIPLDHK